MIKKKNGTLFRRYIGCGIFQGEIYAAGGGGHSRYGINRYFLLIGKININLCFVELIAENVFYNKALLFCQVIGLEAAQHLTALMT